MPLPETAPSKACVCGRWLAGVEGSKPHPPLPGTQISVLWLLCLITSGSLCRADHSSRGVLPNVMCLSAIVKPGQREGPGSLGGCWAVK